MIVETVTTPDLPVLWWAFWLLVAVGIFLGLVWWVTQAALREDRARAAGRYADRDTGRDTGRDAGDPEAT